MKTTIVLFTLAASIMAQDNPDNKATTTKTASATTRFYTTATLADGAVTVIEMPYSDGFYTTTVKASMTGAGPFYTTATLADGAVTVIEMPYSDGFYTTTVKASMTGAGPFYTTATLNDGAVTVIEMPYSDGFYTATQSGVYASPTPATPSTNRTTTSSPTSMATYTGVAAPILAGRLLQGGAAALGAAAYLL